MLGCMTSRSFRRLSLSSALTSVHEPSGERPGAFGGEAWEARISRRWCDAVALGDRAAFATLYRAHLGQALRHLPAR